MGKTKQGEFMSEPDALRSTSPNRLNRRKGASQRHAHKARWCSDFWQACRASNPAGGVWAHRTGGQAVTARRERVRGLVAPVGKRGGYGYRSFGAIAGTGDRLTKASLVVVYAYGPNPVL
jgi:hypothetical protein